MNSTKTQNGVSGKNETAWGDKARKIWASPAWAPVFAHLAGLEPWIEKQQIAVTTLAAPTHFEGLRAEWMARTFGELGLRAEMDAAGNVVAEHPGVRLRAPMAVLTAHMDTAFPAGTSVQVQRRQGRLWAPGISDNGCGLAALLAVARALRDCRIRTRNPIMLVANVGEEGEGDLKGMRELFRPGSRRAKRIGWTLVLDGPGTDQITTEALPSLRLRLTIEGPGGHSWSDLGRASAAHAAARVATALLAQVRPEAGELGCNIGIMQSGSAVNAIAAEAQLKLDLRARAADGIVRLRQAVRRALAIGLEQENEAALSGCVRGRIETIGERPGGTLAAESPLLALVRTVDEILGIQAATQCASTDANIPIAQGREALRLGAGGRAGGIHTLQEWFDPEGRILALQRILLVALVVAGAEPPRGRFAPQLRTGRKR